MGKKLGLCCTFSLKEIAGISVPRLCWLVVDAMWPTSIQNSISLEIFSRGQRRASYSAPIPVNTNHNICSYRSHGWITLSTSLYSNEEWQGWGLETLRMFRSGLDCSFPVGHWLHRDREKAQYTRTSHRSLLWPGALGCDDTRFAPGPPLKRRGLSICLLNPQLLKWRYTENAPWDRIQNNRAKLGFGDETGWP